MVNARFGLVSSGHEDIEVACLSSDDVGDLVYVSDELDGSGRWRVTKADCFDEAKMPAVGIVIEKITSTTGVMRRVGEIDSFTGLDVTKYYYVGADGALQEGPPSAPSGQIAVAQRIGIPIDPDVLWLTGEIGSLFKLVGY